MTTRPVETVNKALLDRIGARQEDDRNRRSCRLGRQGRRRARDAGDNGHLSTDQISGQCRQSIVATLRPAILDRHVAALNIAGFAQALMERARSTQIEVRGSTAEESDYRHRRLLRTRRKRPSSCTAERGYQFPPSDGDWHVPLSCGGTERYHAASKRSSRSGGAGIAGAASHNDRPLRVKSTHYRSATAMAGSPQLADIWDGFDGQSPPGHPLAHVAALAVLREELGHVLLLRASPSPRPGPDPPPYQNGGHCGGHP